MSKKLFFIVLAIVRCPWQHVRRPRQHSPPQKPAAVKPAPAEQAAAPAGNVKELNILWAQWDPADYLQQIGNMYEEETGIKVNIVQEPWGTFGDRFFTEMAARATPGTWSWATASGWARPPLRGTIWIMTEFMNSTGLKDSVTPATLTYYGEYPTGSGTYWAYPTEGDADGWAYRKDLFENPDEQAAFKAKYGYDLAPPDNLGAAQGHRRVLHPPGPGPLRRGHLHAEGLRRHHHGLRERDVLLWRRLERRRQQCHGRDQLARSDCGAEF